MQIGYSQQNKIFLRFNRSNFHAKYSFNINTQGLHCAGGCPSGAQPLTQRPTLFCYDAELDSLIRLVCSLGRVNVTVYNFKFDVRK